MQSTLQRHVMQSFKGIQLTKNGVHPYKYTWQTFIYKAEYKS